MNEKPSGPPIAGVEHAPGQDPQSIIGHLAGSVAHDLSHPLAMIMASSQSLLSLLPPIDADAALSDLETEHLRQDARLIAEEAQRASELVGSVLALARPPSSESKMVALTDVVRRVTTLVEGHLHLCNIQLDAPVIDRDSVPPRWACVRGDANQIQQMLLNLIVNAQQAISADRRSGHLRVRVAPRGPDRVVLTVDDDGPGVPASIRNAIFRPFFTTKGSGPGSGLGLSIIEDIMRRHDGTVECQPGPLGGACFALTFPVTPGTAALPVHPGTGPAEPVGRVLLVDDEAGVRRTIARYLERVAFEVITASSADEALEWLASETFDVIVTDFRMPAMDGQAFYRRVQEDFPDMATRIIFSSGDIMRPETEAFLNQCGRPALQKPFDMGDLVTLLRRECGLDPDDQLAPTG